MRTKIATALAGALAAMMALALVPGAATAGAARGSGQAEYRVTIRTLTKGQPLTPPVLAVGNNGFHLFRVGNQSSVGLKEVAENGNVPALVNALSQTRGVSQVTAGMEPLVPAGLPGSASFGDHATFTVHSDGGARWLSFASMLICTNDGFTGIDHVWLPRALGAKTRVPAYGWDAGTEINTEDFADMVPPCQGLVGVSSGDAGSDVSNPTLFENGVIYRHSGVEGGSDLVEAVHGWNTRRAVAIVTIERVA